MEDHRLRAFCLIVENKSFSKAAEIHLITQSAMSHLIRNLEKEIGVRLLIREGRSVHPTSAGKVFYDHAKRILDMYSSMMNDIGTFADRVKGTLLIGASPIASAYLLPQAMFGFVRAHPEIDIELSVSHSPDLIKRLDTGKIDIGIIEGPVKKASFSCIDIAEDEIVIIASDANSLAGRKTLTAFDVAKEPCILPEQGSSIREFIREFFTSSGISMKELLIPMTIADTELIIQMVKSGLGIAFVSKWSVFEDIKEGSLRVLNITGREMKRTFFLISTERDPISLTASAFQQFIRNFRFFTPF